MMKNKKTNKVILFVLVGLIIFISLLIFILNYSKDDSSFSILEKKWIKDHKDNVIDVSIYNDVPIYGKNGEGIAFDFLKEFTESYEINFNMISYFSENNDSLKDVAFKVLGYNQEMSKKDILMYEDSYVILSRNQTKFDSLKDIKDITLAVLEDDIEDVTYYLDETDNVSYLPYKDFDGIKEVYDEESIDYMILPYNKYLDEILTNDLNIVYHLNDMTKKYVLSVENDSLNSIMKKFYNKYMDKYYDESYKELFTKEFFNYKEISDQEQASYNSRNYTYGFVTNIPFESSNNNEYVGIFVNYLKQFSKLVNVDFTFKKYSNINDLRDAFKKNEVDFVFGNFNMDNLNIDITKTLSLFKEEYVVLSNQNLVVNSVRTLKDEEVYTIKDTKLYDYLKTNNLNIKGYNNNEALFTNLNNAKILILDKDVYEYYKNKRLSSYKVLYTGVLEDDYNFIIRDVSMNKTFAELFSYYITTINYNQIRYNYNSNFNLNDINSFEVFIKYLILSIIIIGIVIGVTIFLIRKKKQANVIKKDEKLKFIDMLTSLKNRNYLTYNMPAWDENVIYPQAIIMIDLNNLKLINDNHGYVEGDNVIKKAASILINSQLENTDIIRTDGNEFLIYMVGYEEKQVVAYTRKLYKELKELPYGYGAAIGYSMILDDIKLIDDAIAEATLDMNENKENK